MKTSFDIKTIGNMMTGRQGWAYICNSGKFAVIKADLDAPQEYDDYRKYGKVRVVKTYKDGRELHTTATVAADKDKWKFTSGGAFISSRFGYADMVELADNANLPVVRQDDIVAVMCYSDKMKLAILTLSRVEHVDIHCMTVASLKPLTEEEMNSVVADADRWCRR